MTRVVSLVPSLTETVAALGAAGSLVGVTRYCTRGAPPAARRVGGTKSADVDAVLGLAPDVVLANAEENRAEDLQRLRDAGLDVQVSFPRTVDDVVPMLRGVAAAVGADPRPLVEDIQAAAAEADARRPPAPVAHATLIWRRPWRALGPDTYADDLLRRCGFANVLAGWDERYPRLEPGLRLGPQVVLLPDEPYPFAAPDAEAVRALLGPAPQHYVDGRLLTWHGAATAAGLRAFSTLAAELSA